jgi:hypothetical protein
LGSFKIVEEGSRPAGDKWTLQAEVNGSSVGRWDYAEGFSQSPFIHTFHGPTIQLEIKASAIENDGTSDEGTREGAIEFECPYSGDFPIREALEAKVVEDRGAQGRVEHWYTTWQFEFVVEPLLVQYHE